MVKNVFVHNVILYSTWYTITSCCNTGLSYIITIGTSLYCVITVRTCGSPNRKESSPNSSSTICCKLEPPPPSSPRPPRSCGLVPSSVQVQLPVSVHRLTCATLCSFSSLLRAPKLTSPGEFFRALFETLSSSPDITQTFVVGAMEWLRGWMYQRYCGG